MNRIEKTFQFGKIGLYGKRKINSVEVEVALEDYPTKPVFTVSATVWNQSKTDCILAGQCLDTLVPYLKDNELFMKIHRLWKLYHLNNMKAGTPKQEAAVEEYLKDHKYDYKEVCDYLESINLLEDNGYRYGTSWLYAPIVEVDLNEIKSLFF